MIDDEASSDGTLKTVLCTRIRKLAIRTAKTISYDLVLLVVLSWVGNKRVTGTELTLGEASVRLVLPLPETANFTLFNGRDKVHSSVDTEKTVVSLVVERGIRGRVDKVASGRTVGAVIGCGGLIGVGSTGADRAAGLFGSG